MDVVFNAFVLISDDGGANSVLFFFILGDGLGVLDVLCFGNVVLFRGLISLASMVHFCDVVCFVVRLHCVAGLGNNMFW